MSDDDYFDIAPEKPGARPVAVPGLPPTVQAAADEAAARMCLSGHEKRQFDNELQLLQSWWHSLVPGAPMTRYTRDYARSYCEKYLLGMPVTDRQNRLQRFVALWQVMCDQGIVDENVFGSPLESGRGWVIHPDIQRVFLSPATTKTVSTPLASRPAKDEEDEADDGSDEFSSVDTDEWTPPVSPISAPPAPASPKSQLHAVRMRGRRQVDLPALQEIVRIVESGNDMRSWRDALLVVMAYLKPGILVSELVRLTRGDVLRLAVGDELVSGLRRWPLTEGIRQWLNYRPPETPAFDSCRPDHMSGRTAPERVSASSVSQMLSRAGRLVTPPVSMTMRSLTLLTPEDDDADEMEAAGKERAVVARNMPVTDAGDEHPAAATSGFEPVECEYMPAADDAPAPEPPTPLPAAPTTTERPGAVSLAPSPPPAVSTDAQWVDQLMNDIVRAWNGRLMGSVEMIEQVTGEPAYLWQQLVEHHRLPAVQRIGSRGFLVLARSLAQFIGARSFFRDT